MGKIMRIGKVFECFSNSCFSIKIQDEYDQTKPLIAEERISELLKLKDDIIDGKNHTLALQLKPKVVVLRVSMHCNGCARKVEKHIAKMEGVDSYKVDLESQKVIITGDIYPFEVLHCVSKVKNAELLETSY